MSKASPSPDDFDLILQRARRIESLVLWHSRDCERLKELIFSQIDVIQNICKERLGYASSASSGGDRKLLATDTTSDTVHD
jgi:hypothetical protein